MQCLSCKKNIPELSLENIYSNQTPLLCKQCSYKQACIEILLFIFMLGLMYIFNCLR